MIQEVQRVTKKGCFRYNQECNGCGELKAVRKDVYQKRIQRYGSEENLLKQYICRKCRKKRKREKKKNESSRRI